MSERLWEVRLTICDSGQNFYFHAERTVLLPFVPVPGMTLEFPEYERSVIKLENVTWHTDKQVFEATSSDYDEGNGLTYSGVKDWYEQSGWTLTLAEDRTRP